MSTPTNSPSLDGAHPLARLWLRPVEELLPTLHATKDKPIGQFTMTELIAWAAVVGYMATSMALAQTLAFNLARVAIRGR